MAGPPAELFLEAVESVVRENSQWVPPQGKGSLYLRPLLLGSGPILGLGPAPAYTLVVFAAAVGAYFKVPFCSPLASPAPKELLNWIVEFGVRPDFLHGDALPSCFRLIGTMLMLYQAVPTTGMR